ncbi:MAG: hypothetical protein WBQ41_04045 [Solirubrobacterales bacterium]
MPSRRIHALPLAAVLVGMALTAAGCGGSSNTSNSTSAPAGTPSAAATTTATATSTTSTVGGDLTGTWSGKYSGAYSGTFDLNWQQSGSTLSGTIKLSNPGGTEQINGTVNGSAIKFGTVGGPGITYSGSVSGSSMSGSYQTPGGGGPWSASKTS